MNDKLINTINITQNENEEVYGTITARNATDAAQLDAVSIVKWLDDAADVLSRKRVLVHRLSENSEFYFFRTTTTTTTTATTENYEKNTSETST